MEETNNMTKQELQSIIDEAVQEALIQEGIFGKLFNNNNNSYSPKMKYCYEATFREDKETTLYGTIYPSEKDAVDFLVNVFNKFPENGKVIISKADSEKLKIKKIYVNKYKVIGKNEGNSYKVKFIENVNTYNNIEEAAKANNIAFEIKDKSNETNNRKKICNELMKISKEAINAATKKGYKIRGYWCACTNDEDKEDFIDNNSSSIRLLFGDTDGVDDNPPLTTEEDNEITDFLLNFIKNKINKSPLLKNGRVSLDGHRNESYIYYDL